MTAAPLPLSGVRVLDLGQIYNGPYAGFLLAMNGAEVVKVEPPAGDPLRARGAGLDIPVALAMLNSNKRGLAIDLKHPRGKALLIELAKRADVLLENYAPGVMDRLGLGASVLQEANPRLIYASSTGYGLSGPARDTLAMDLTIQAYAGVMSINGPEDGPPLKAGLAICDFMGGVHLYGAIATALYERSVTGRGRVVEISMQEAIYPALATSVSAMYANDGRQPPRRGNRHPAGTSAPYNVYPCADGHVAIICVREPHWRSLLGAMGREDLADDPRFADQKTRAANVEATDAVVAAWTAGLPKREVARILRERHVPAAPVRTIPDVIEDEHMHFRGMLQRVAHPALGETVLPSSPMRFHGSDQANVAPSPALGQHAAGVLRDWLGLDDEAVADLGASGAVVEGDTA